MTITPRIFGRYGCNDCGGTFHAQHGPTMDGDELRCERCDHAELFTRPAPSHKVCPRCQGAMQTGLEPMCPRCGSRAVIFIVPGNFFDY